MLPTRTSPTATWTSPRRPAPIRYHGGRPRRSDDVDEVAVDRAMYGDHAVRLNVAERRRAVATLTALGYTAHQIADRLALSQRTVVRHRAVVVRSSAPVCG